MPIPVEQTDTGRGDEDAGREPGIAVPGDVDMNAHNDGARDDNIDRRMGRITFSGTVVNPSVQETVERGEEPGERPASNAETGSTTFGTEIENDSGGINGVIGYESMGDDALRNILIENDCPLINSDTMGSHLPNHAEMVPGAKTSLEYLMFGNCLKEDGKFTKSLEVYRAGLKACPSSDVMGRYELLMARSKAAIEYAEALRTLPASISETSAVYAPDPTNLATSALKDANAALEIHTEYVAKAHLARCRALKSLEKYGEAAEAAKLSSESFKKGSENHCKAQAILASVEQELRGFSSSRANVGGGNGNKKQKMISDTENGERSESQGDILSCEAFRALSNELECPLCLKLLWEPVTTPCGHTFCKPCFVRAIDHGAKCPNCRRVLHLGHDLPVTVVLKTLLKTAFPFEYESRSMEENDACDVSKLSADLARIPLFVMSPLLPGETMALNIFEPRYRLMIRRCMEGGRSFGMAVLSSSSELHDAACAAQISECEPLPDGRFYIEIRGTKRFKPVDVDELDGYRTARPQWFGDEMPDSGSQEYIELESLAAEVDNLADVWLSKLRTMSQTRRGLIEFLGQIGDKPSDPNDKESLSFWICTLLSPLLDSRQFRTHKLRMLSTRSTSERLTLCRELLSSSQQNLAGCSIM